MVYNLTSLTTSAIQFSMLSRAHPVLAGAAKEVSVRFVSAFFVIECDIKTAR
jgi:hypothetical protein